MQKKVKVPVELKKFNITENGRVDLGRKPIAFQIPDFNQVQVESYKQFLQADVLPENRKNIGLQFLFTSRFPFYSNDKKIRLEFDNYVIGEPKFSIEEAIEKDRSYVAPVKATIRLILTESGEIKEQEIFVCDVPLMTNEGIFIINGALRVVVSQIHRSPGVIFDYNKRFSIYHSRLIPERGPWIEFEIVKEIMYVRIDRKQRIPATVLLRACGIIGYREILDLFYTKETVTLEADIRSKEENAQIKFYDVLTGKVLAQDVILNLPSSDDQSTDEGIEQNISPAGTKKKPDKSGAPGKLTDKDSKNIIKIGTRLTREIIDSILDSGIQTIECINAFEMEKDSVIYNTLERDKISTQENACIFLYTVIRASEPPSNSAAKSEMLVRWKCTKCDEIHDSFLRPAVCAKCGASEDKIERIDKSIFFNSEVYSLGQVGRYKINKRFDYSDPDTSEVLTVRDIVHTMKYLLKVRTEENPSDDIDHLGNRRIRSVGEQLTNHLKVCFARLERLARERMTIHDHNTFIPQTLISIKPITAGIKEFFGTAQLSQFMDQTNPVAAITHKRRLNALGPGGLTRERAGFEVRDIHYTHYGRMCPIETPEGPNIGLILSLATYAKINEYGFIETPYYKVENGRVTEEVVYLSAIEEDRYSITPYTDELNDKGDFIEKMIPTRKQGNYPMSFPKDVNLMDVAPAQIISITSSLIPFLEHDDANRALMGSNMMRQSVPLLFPESPIVGTGVEGKVAEQSGFVVRADADGEIIYADNSRIELKEKGRKDPYCYNLKKSMRTNQDTFFNQRPIVEEGQAVSKGEVICDGSAVENAELAMGSNVLCAFMSWEGYNYEDAILMSENLIKTDKYTSIHVEEFECESRETKLGKESLTRDIPNISEDDYRDLDNDGVVRIGAKVKAGSILVGKVTPKGHTEITPEYKLLHSIFGEKARDVKDTSLRVPHGTEGVVIGVKLYTRENRDDLKPGVIQKVKIFVAKKRRLREGDKFAGRHGNKGVVARILPAEDMPFMADGRPIDIVLNPLGVPSRMNLGQVYELTLGWIGHEMGVKFSTPVFNGIKWNRIQELLRLCNLPESGKTTLFDGRSGEPFLNQITVGYMYYIKLAHLADDKIHARSTGPYSLVTQQPLGGKAQFGGQRVGEMEVWAIEAYGAANILQEFLTVKSDAMEGRTKIYEAIIKGEYVSTPGVPESFNVLVQELRGLGLKIDIYDVNNNEINITPNKKDRDKKKRLI